MSIKRQLRRPSSWMPSRFVTLSATVLGIAVLAVIIVAGVLQHTLEHLPQEAPPILQREDWGAALRLAEIRFEDQYGSLLANMERRARLLHQEASEKDAVLSFTKARPAFLQWEHAPAQLREGGNNLAGMYLVLKQLLAWHVMVSQPDDVHLPELVLDVDDMHRNCTFGEVEARKALQQQHVSLLAQQTKLQKAEARITSIRHDLVDIWHAHGKVGALRLRSSNDLLLSLLQIEAGPIDIPLRRPCLHVPVGPVARAQVVVLFPVGKSLNVSTARCQWCSLSQNATEADAVLVRNPDDAALASAREKRGTMRTYLLIEVGEKLDLVGQSLMDEIYLGHDVCVVCTQVRWRKALLRGQLTQTWSC